MAVSTKISLDNNKVVQSSGKILTLSGNTLIASSGTLKYLTDTSSTYDARSVTDAGFVTGLTSAISSNLSSNYYTKTVINNYTGATDTRIGDIESDVAISLTGASNGLTKVGNHDVKLGGVITESTIITDNRGTPVGIQYGGDYSANYTPRSLVDAGYVTGLTSAISSNLSGNYYTKTVINNYTGATDTRISDIESDVAISLTGASNGLTKVGDHDVELGGALTKNTNICGSYQYNINVNTINLTGITNGVNLTGVVTLKTQPSGSGGLLCINSTTGEICQTSLSAFGGVTGATNGLSVCSNQNIGFGGSLCNNTTITGDYDLCFGTSGDKLNKFELNTSDDVVINSDGIINMVLSGGTITTNDLRGLRYTNDYSTTFTDNSLVTKAYVDGIAVGLDPKSAVVVATTTGNNLDLSGVEVIDGITTDTGMRVLVKNQTNKAENGIYIANNSGAWTRATDFDGTPDGEVTQGALIPVLSGSTNINSSWILITNDPITINTTELNFSKFSQLLEISEGNGIDITTVGQTKSIGVELANNSGLYFNGTGLSINPNVAGSGLTWNNGIVSVNATTGGNSSIWVRFDNSNNLVVNADDISNELGGVVNDANNGLTLSGSSLSGGTLSVILGGNLVTPTMICGNDTNTLTYRDTAITNKVGILYDGDYSASFVNRSLVDKEYVDTLISISGASAIYANNGLTINDTTITLGGELTNNTHIYSPTYDFCLESNDLRLRTEGNFKIFANNGGLSYQSFEIFQSGGMIISTYSSLPVNPFKGIEYDCNYHSNYTSRSLVDAEYVTGLTSQSIIYASNGLSKIGNTVVLGGNLTGDTTITGCYNKLKITGLTEYNITAGYFNLCTTRVIIGAGSASSGSVIIDTRYGGSANGNHSLSMMTGVASGNSSIAIGSDGCVNSTALGDYSIAIGLMNGGAIATADCSIVIGQGNNQSIGGVVISNGYNVLSSGNTHSIILGGSGINVPADNYQSTAIVANLAIWNTPSTGSVSNSVLVWDSTDKKVKSVDGSSLGDKNNIYDVCVVNSNTTLTLTGDTYVVMVDTSSQPISLTLSSNGLVSGRTVKIKDGSGNALSNNITITSPTLSFDGDSDAVINTDFGALELIYTEGVGACEWKVLSFYN